MATDKGYKKMRELIKALAEAERSMEAGTLGHEGLEQAAIHARELYERLVILRHRSREAKISGKSPKKETGPETLAKEMETISSVAGEPAPPPMRLDTRPPEISPRQTSLIEAIEASEASPEEKAEKIASVKEGRNTSPPEEPPAARNDKPAPAPEPKTTAPAKPAEAPKPAEKAPVAKRADKPASLAEKLNKASIPSLGKAISLSHKFWFVSELYNGDRIFYEKSIDMLDNMKEKQEAEIFVQKEVIARLKKPADPEALNTFMELIERRFQ